MKPPRETDLVRNCLALLNYYSIPAWRQNQGAMREGKRFIRFAGAKGISDIIGLVPPTGRLLAVECKIAPNKPTDDQEAFLGMVAESGGVALVVYDVMDLKQAIEKNLEL